MGRGLADEDAEGPSSDAEDDRNEDDATDGEADGCTEPSLFS